MQTTGGAVVEPGYVCSTPLSDTNWSPLLLLNMWEGLYDPDFTLNNFIYEKMTDTTNKFTFVFCVFLVNLKVYRFIH